MKILHIDCSKRFTGSASRKLSARFVDRLVRNGVALEIDRLDLALAPPQHFGEAQTAAIYLAESERTADMAAALAESDALCDRVLATDAIVCGIPMYNFGMPSVFKVFVDNIVRSDKTFEVTEQGITGRLSGKKAVFIMTTGGNYKPGAMFDGMDCLTPHLQTVFAFVGIANPDIVHAQPMQFEGPVAKARAFEAAETAVAALADKWVHGLGAGADRPVR